MNEDTCLQLSSDELAISHVLSVHVGRRRAMPMRELAEAVDLPTRTVQSVVKHLIEWHRCPIGSATGTPHGYYLMEEPEDVTRAITQLLHRVKSQIRRIACLKQTTDDLVLGQLQLDLAAERGEDARE